MALSTNPPSNEPGRWLQGSDGQWYENPGYTGGRTVAQTDPEGAKTVVAEQRRPNGLTLESFNAKQSSGFDDKLLQRLFNRYTNIKGYSWGNGAVFHDYAKSVLSDPAYAQQFKRRPMEDYNSWISRIDKTFPGIMLAADMENMRHDPEVQDYFSFDNQKGPDGLTAAEAQSVKEQKERQATLDQIKAFADSLLRPLSMEDPEVRNIMTMTRGAVQDDARNRGIEGPLSIANSEQATLGQLGQYNTQRQQLGLQALQYKDQSQLQEGQRKMGLSQAQWEADAGAAIQRHANETGPYKTIGGLGGAAIGGVGGFFAGGPAGAAAGASAGFNVGSGLGGVAAGNPAIPPPPRTYKGY